MAREKKEDKKLNFKEQMEALNKDYGMGTVVSLKDKTRSVLDVIPSGSLRMDYQLFGIGGWALNRIYELRGWEGSGKSTICGHACAEAQKKIKADGTNRKVVYIDGEHSLDVDYFKAIGVDVDSLVLCQPDHGDQGFNVALKLIETGEVELLIIDSDSSLLPKGVMEGEVGDSAIGKKARLNSDMYPKLKVAVTKYHTCAIVVSQFREKIGVMFGNPETTQGGHALKFYSDTILEVRKSLKKEGDEMSGNITNVKATKNKTYRPYIKVTFDVLFGVGIDREGELLDLAVDMDIINKSGSWYSYGENKIGQGSEAVAQFFQDNPEFMEEVKNKVIEQLKPEIKTVTEEQEKETVDAE